MQVWYRHNKRKKVYDDHRPPTSPNPPEQVYNPLPRCLGCPYPGHGFVCGNGERCMRSEMSRLMERDRGPS